MIQVFSGKLATAVGMAILAMGITIVLSGAVGADSESEQGCVSATTRNGNEVVCYGAIEDTHLSLTSVKTHLESEGASFAFVSCTMQNFVVWQRNGFSEPDYDYITDEGRQPAGAPDEFGAGRWVSFSPDLVISRCGPLYAWKVNGFRSAIIEPDVMSQGGPPDDPPEGEFPGEWVKIRIGDEGFYTHP